MLRTWAVKFPAMALTLSVKSFQVPATPSTCGLAAELAVGADLARHPRHLRGERAQLIDHGVDGLFELQDFAAHIDGDLARQVAVGHGNGDLGDVAHLGGQIAGHRVDALGQILPHATDAADLRLAAELAVGAHFPRHPRHLGGEHAKLLDHGVDDGGRAQELALQRPPVHIQLHRLRQVPLRHGRDGTGDFGGRSEQIVDESVDGDFHLAPGAFRLVKSRALPRFPLFAHDLPDALELLSHLLVSGNDLIERVGDLAFEPRPMAWEAHGKFSSADGLQASQ